MTVIASLPPDLFEKPDHYLFELRGREGGFAKMNRDTYFRSIFLDSARIKPVSREIVVHDVEQLVAALNERNVRPARINFIFHTANCGSTLLSRALDLPGRTLACREPLPLRQLGVEAAGANSRARDNPGWHKRLELILTLLGRRYSETEVPTVKANIPVNFILPEVLGLLPDVRVLLLYSRLETFLVSVLRHPQRRHWARSVSHEVSGGIFASGALSGVMPDNLSAPKTAATLWVAQMIRFHEVLTKSKGLRTLESDQFFEQTEKTLLHTAEHFEIDIDTDEISAIANGELFSRYSKDPTIQYNTQTRAHVRASVLAEFGEEVDEGMQWGATLMEQCGIPQDPPGALF